MRAFQIYCTKIVFFTVYSIQIFAQSNFYEPLKLDTVKWSFNDFGKMWTFDNIPVKLFEEKYGFSPTERWLNNVQKSALQFGEGCSASFVSEDGLILTNHHCGRNQLASIQKEGENILKDGFYAEILHDERKINNLYVDQLILIEDVTEQIKKYMSIGKSDNEKVQYREEIKDSLIIKYNVKTGLTCKIVTLYQGGKYSLYGYKRYNDIRLVMAPDFQIAATGWDLDNFTYPRYELDFMFYRAYDDNGVPVKCENYFTWSNTEAGEEEPIFVVGRPGSTDRLYSFAQLEYLRDFVYPSYLAGYNAIYNAYLNHYMSYPKREELLNSVMRWGNARKSFAGRLAGVNNDYIMKKKMNFQSDLITKIVSSPDLFKKYGKVWNSIDSVISELSKFTITNTVLRFNRILRPEYFNLAEKMIEIAKQKEFSNDDRNYDYKDENLTVTIDELYPDEIEFELHDNLLEANINFLTSILDSSDTLITHLFENKKGSQAVKLLKKKSKLLSKDSFIELSKKKSSEILKSDDPFIKYVLYIDKISSEFSGRVNELNNSLSVLNELLGEAVYKVYGNKIPPDATSTLRISDGVIRGYEYNGTIAPGKTTFYGLWDRYESFNKKTYPWGLHDRWVIPPGELDLSIDIGFASTNDIVGGNSGSSVINLNQEVVGLVHDGNIESLSGHTIFLEENNRTVATDSQGLLEALKYVYKTERLVRELLNGKIN